MFKLILLALIASQVVIAQERETVWGDVPGRDHVVRNDERITTGQNERRFEAGRRIASIRAFDLTNGLTSRVAPIQGGIGDDFVVLFVNSSIANQPFDVRITVFSGSSIVHVSLVVMIATMLFSFLMK